MLSSAEMERDRRVGGGGRGAEMQMRLSQMWRQAHFYVLNSGSVYVWVSAFVQDLTSAVRKVETCRARAL